MQYMSEDFRLGIAMAEYNHSDMFSMFKKRIEETNEGCEEHTQLVSFCMKTMTEDFISLDELEDMTEECLINAINTLEEVRDILNNNSTLDAREIPLEGIPKNLHKFFTVNQGISLFEKLSNAKATKNKSARKRKTKLFF